MRNIRRAGSSKGPSRIFPGNCYSVPATDKAMEIGPPILGNMIMIGALLELNLLPLSAAEFQKTLAKNFSGKRLETNLQALEEGKRIIRPN